jgi:hypothetical protein
MIGHSAGLIANYPARFSSPITKVIIFPVSGSKNGIKPSQPQKQVTAKES